MVATKTDQKSTAMDYLSAPRSEGLVVALLSILGFEAPKGGRLPAGVKYDSLLAMRDVFSISESFSSIKVLSPLDSTFNLSSGSVLDALRLNLQFGNSILTPST